MADYVIVEQTALPTGAIRVRVRLRDFTELQVTVPRRQTHRAGIIEAVERAVAARLAVPRPTL